MKRKFVRENDGVVQNLKRIDVHDRFEEFQKQSDLISKGCEDCIKSRPEEFENHPFYIFAHSRTIESDERIALFNHDIAMAIANPRYERQYKVMADVPTSRLIWEPRLTKPYAQTNSMLFKAYPPSDVIKVIWMIPAPELWDQYDQGKITENKVISESIHNFKTTRNLLDEPEADDLPENVIRKIYLEIAKNARIKKKFQKKT